VDAAELVSSVENRAPVASTQTLAATVGTPLSITLAATDADGDTLTYAVTVNPALGTLSGTGANRTYTPTNPNGGSDSFAFRANDGVLDSEPAVVSIVVSPANPLPVTQLSNGVKVSGLSGAAGSEQFFTIEVPTPIYNLTVVLSGGTGDADLYLRHGAQPTPHSVSADDGETDKFSYNGDTNNETVFSATPAVGTHHVLVHGWHTGPGFSGVDLQANWSVTPPPPPPPPPDPDPDPYPDAIERTTVSRGGVTWAWQGMKLSGQYANGDWWVVGPVTITSITPASVNSPRIMHGSMLNPVAGVTAKQGFDNTAAEFDSSLNVGRPNGNAISAANPLVITSGSLMSSESIIDGITSSKTLLEEIAILTVVSSPPPANSFRPPYCGTDKTHRWNKSQLDYSALRSLAPVVSTPSLATLASRFEKPWIEINTQWMGDKIHPVRNQPDYGRNMGYLINDALLSLNLNYSNSQKETLLIRMVQYGIDIYGAAVNGAFWQANGGHGQSRKAPMLFAGRLLNDSNILRWGDKSFKNIFACDHSFFYISQEDVNRPRYTADGRPRDPYTSAMIGTPEWGEQHNRYPERDGSNWDAYYRTISNSALVGGVLAIKLMEMVPSWNNPVVFKYFEGRYVPIEAPYAANSNNSFQLFHANMWAAYAPASIYPAGVVQPT